MVSSSLFLGVLAAVPALAWPWGGSHNKVIPSQRPNIEYSPHRPYQPLPWSPPRWKTCIVPSHNDGKTDDSSAILRALHECNEGGHVIFPRQNNYLIATALDLTFLCHIDLDIQGTILFSNDTTYWQAHAFPQVFQNVTTFFQLGGDDVQVYGGGTLNGNGQVWYDLYASDIYILRPVLFGTIGLHNSIISNLNLRYSPEYYNFVANSSSVVFSDISILGGSVSSNPAKNTDGWDTYRSSNIVIQRSTIVNQDDCVSFKPNSTQMLVQSLSCTGSHGISVGSLGQYPGTYDIVSSIIVSNISLTNVSDGARIKVWPGVPSELSGDLQGGGGSGRVSDILYEDLSVTNADYAIEVTQCYGQKNATLCDLYPSKLDISNVTIKNVHGTSSGKFKGISGYVRCSSPSVCSNIVLEDINVMAPNGSVDLFTCGNVDQADLHGITCTNTDLGSN